MRLLLASMPWAIFNRPSIQLSSLQGYLQLNYARATVETCHPYLTAADKIGLDAYRILSENSWAAEALYCALLFPANYQQARQVFHQSLNRDTLNVLPHFDLLIQQLDDHLDNWFDGLQLDDCHLAGFTVCFSQLPATLLAAKRIKNKFPGLAIVLGGSTCAPRIGHSLLKVFPEIDFIINGEGEKPLLGLVRFLAGETENPGPNVQLRSNPGKKKIPAEPAQLQSEEIPDLNTLPTPNFDDYFRDLKKTGLSFIPTLPIEFSRGCWWNKCTFCNLNLQWCGYRFKRSKKVLQEVNLLTERYRTLDFAFTDNSLPPKEADRFFAASAQSGRNLRYFGEIRTGGSPATYARYHDGGLRTIQVGIEAFSNSLLQRMNKGCRVMDNIAAMKYAMESGLKLDGNLILEFPGSTEMEVAETSKVLDYVYPYRPLKTAGFFLGHGSPVWQNPKQYGLQAVTQHPYNRRLYPKELLAELEMLVLSHRGDRRLQQKIWKPVRDKIRLWHDFHANRKNNRPTLAYREGGNFIIIRQEHPGGATLHHKLQGLSRNIYLACCEPVAIKTLLAEFNSITEKQMLTFLTDLRQKRLLFQDDNLCLALAVKDN